MCIFMSTRKFGNRGEVTEIGEKAMKLEDAMIILKEKIPVQDPAIKTSFMSIDEIARIFSKSQSLYRGLEKPL